jgi:hypothetical protein
VGRMARRSAHGVRGWGGREGWREAVTRGERVGREGGKTGCGCVWGREVVWKGLARSPPLCVCSPCVLQGEREGGWLDGRRARTDGVGGGERKPIADQPRWWGKSGLYENAQAPSSRAWSFKLKSSKAPKLQSSGRGVARWTTGEDGWGGRRIKPNADLPRWWGESGLHENAQAPSFKLQAQARSLAFRK